MNKQTLLNAIEKFIKAEEAYEAKNAEVTAMFPEMSGWDFMDVEWEQVDAIMTPFNNSWKETRAKMFDTNVKYCAKTVNQYMARKVAMVQKERPSEAAELLKNLYNKS